MAKKGKTYFVLDTDDGWRTLLSISEKSDGELTIFPKFAENYSERQYGNLNADEPIKEQHYSIHNSANSAEGINALKHTLTLHESPVKTTRIYTRAFKHNNLSSPLYGARVQDLTPDRYSTQKKERNNYIVISSYEPRNSTLYYMLVVSNAGTVLADNYPDLNIKTFQYSKYAVSIIWSFGTIPSHTTGEKIHFMTSPESEITNQMKEGMSEPDIVHLYRSTRAFQHEKFLEYLKSDMAADDYHKVDIIKTISFKKTPSFQLTEFDKQNLELFRGYELFRLGVSKQESENHHEALFNFEESENVFKAINFLNPLPHLYSSQGISLQVIGEPEKALKIYMTALSLFKSQNNTYQEARLLLNIAIIYRDMGQYDMALKYANDSAFIAKNEDFNSILSNTYRELGIYNMRMGNPEPAIANLSSAKERYEEEEDKSGVAFCLGNLGLLMFQKHDFETALKFHQDALDIFTTVSNLRGMANEVANVGNTNCVLGNFDLGRKQLFDALKLHQNINYKYGEATDLKLIGISYLNSGENELAIKYLSESSSLLKLIRNYLDAQQIDDILKNIQP